MARKPEHRDERRAEDEVAEAGYESFPASDPPAYNTPGRGESESRDSAPTAERGESIASGEKVSRLDPRSGSHARQPRRRPRADAPATTAEMRDRMPSRRTMGKSSAEDPAAAPFDTDDEAAGRPAQRSAIEQAMARQNVRVGRGHPPAPPTGDPSRVGRAAFVGMIVLAVALVVWLFLA